MLKLLLKKNEIESINILGSTLYGLDTSIPFIEKHILNNKSTVKHNLNYLNDIFILLNHKNIRMRLSNNKVILEGSYNDIHDNLLFDVSVFLILNSATYKVLAAFLTVSNPTNQFIVQHAHVSSSYLTKIIREINQTLEHTGLKIISRKQKLYVIGPTLTKLYFEYLLRRFLSFLNPTEQVKLKLKNLESSIFSTASSDLKKETVSCLYTTFDHTAKNTDDVYIQNVDIIQILDTFISVNDLSLKIPSNNKTITQERYLINLFLRLTTGEADNFEQRKEISQRLIIHNKNHPNNKIISDIITIGKKFQIFSGSVDPKNKLLYEAIYLVTLKQVTSFLFDSHIEALFDFTPDFISQSITEHNQGIAIIDFTEKLKSDSQLSHSTQKMIELYNDSLIGDLYSLLPKPNVTLKISIDMSYQLAREYYLKKLILDLFSSDSIEFISKKEEADIIISDHIVNTSPDTSLFFLLDTNSSESIDLLFTFITQKYIEKNKNKRLKY